VVSGVLANSRVVVIGRRGLAKFIGAASPAAHHLALAPLVCAVSACA